MSNNLLIPANGTASVVDQIIRIDDKELPSSILILSIVVSKEINRIPRAKIHLLDGDTSQSDFAVSNENFFIPGKIIEIGVGFESDEQLIFKGIVVKHALKMRANGKSHLYVECMDKTFKATIARRNNYFTEVTDSEVIEEILSSYGVETDIEPTELTHQGLVQYESTDWNFMVSRAEANGNLFFVSDGSIIVKKPDFTSDPVLTLQYGSNLHEFDAEIDARNQYPKVKASAWDYSNGELLDTEAVEPNFSGTGNLSSLDLAKAGDIGSFDLRHPGQAIQQELQAWADACLVKSRLSKVCGRAKIQGFAGIKPGETALLQGVGNRFNGKVFVSAVRHDIQGGTWTTDIQFGLSHKWFSEQMEMTPPLSSGLMPGIQGLHIGVVTQLQDDPEGENRILVRIPLISMAEDGVWARIATLDAGAGGNEGRGTFFLPEIGDEVVVGFINGDPRGIVVLGMLHSSAHPAPIKASDDNHQKGYVSRSDLKLLFDDEKKSVLIETPGGKKIHIDEESGSIFLEDENGNKIVMDSSGILLESEGDLIMKAGGNLQVETGTNIELKAGASFNASGSAGAEVTTDAIAVLKGSLVQIN